MHTPKRVVEVSVDVTVGTDGTVGIDCTPNPAPVIKNTKHALLVFTLNTPGFRFPVANAITLDHAVDDFPYDSWTVSDRQAALYDTNKIEDTISYTVTVVNATTGQHFSVDPEIQNGGTPPGGDDC